MKTDLQKFIDLYASVGIELKPENTDRGYTIHIEGDHPSGKIDGYCMFYTKISFDFDERFLVQEIFE